MAWAPDYLTLVQGKAFVRVDDTVDDTEIATAITTSSRSIDDHCNRQFGVVNAVEQRVYRAYYNYERTRWVVAIDDLQTAVGLVVMADGAAITDYVLEPRNAVAEGKAWTRLVFGTSVALVDDDVSATALWGWALGFPVPVVQAAKLQTSRLLSRRDSPYGVAGSPADGSEVRLTARVDPDVAVALRGWSRPRKAG